MRCYFVGYIQYLVFEMDAKMIITIIKEPFQRTTKFNLKHEFLPCCSSFRELLLCMGWGDISSRVLDSQSASLATGLPFAAFYLSPSLFIYFFSHAHFPFM